MSCEILCHAHDEYIVILTFASNDSSAVEDSIILLSSQNFSIFDQLIPKLIETISMKSSLQNKE